MEIQYGNERQSNNEDIILLHQLMRELRDIDRALMLLYLEGLTSSDIAKIINTSQTNVTTKIYRIKKRLRRRFKELKK